MRILLITTGLMLGGAERQVVDLADRLADRGHDVAIAYLAGDAQVHPCNGRVELHPLYCTKSVRGMVAGCLRLRTLIRQWNADVVHSHMVHANLIARLLRLITPMPKLVCTAHSTREGGRTVELAYRITDFLATISTNVSREAVEAFEQNGAVPKGRMIPVFNGIDLNRFPFAQELRCESRQRLFPHPGKQMILAVGRLVVEKNYSALLQVFANVKKAMPKVELWIAGGGDLHAQLEQQSSSLLLNDSVKFLGVRADIPDLMRAADVFVLPSLLEGFGLVVAEAMASGTVTVATDAGGVAEVMNGIGFCVPVGNQAALEAALLQALELPIDQAKALGQAGRRHIEGNFDINQITDRWLDIYHGIYPC
ncbi:MAG: glycosyltransferase [Burkholderiaceae bacterium]